MDPLNFFSGAKTFLAGLGLVGAGVAGMAFGVIDPGTGAMLVGNGFAVWGIGHKLERMVTATKEKTITFADGPQKDLVKALAAAVATSVPSLLPTSTVPLSDIEKAIVATVAAQLTKKETPDATPPA